MPTITFFAGKRRSNENCIILHRYNKMTVNKKLLPLCLLWLGIAQITMAQDTKSPAKKKKVTFTSTVESNLLQFANVEVAEVYLTTVPRYTYFFNSGLDIDFKLNKTFKLFTGVGVKNIGLIIKPNKDIIYKHRVYTVGAPVGVKLNFAHDKVVFKAGADFSVALNYKWKTIINDKKTKKNEWFSDKTSMFFPSVFAGISVHGVAVTANYYLGQFFNPDNAITGALKTQLLTVGLGVNTSDFIKAKKKK